MKWSRKWIQCFWKMKRNVNPEGTESSFSGHLLVHLKWTEFDSFQMNCMWKQPRLFQLFTWPAFCHCLLIRRWVMWQFSQIYCLTIWKDWKRDQKREALSLLPHSKCKEWICLSHLCQDVKPFVCCHTMIELSLNHCDVSYKVPVQTYMHGWEPV